MLRKVYKPTESQSSIAVNVPVGISIGNTVEMK